MRPRMSVKIEEAEQVRRLAILIDADNAQAAVIEGLMAEVAKYGVASVKRIYGDWTSPYLAPWKKCLLDYSINPVQQFAYTKGKNATDSSLIIDAMDLMYTRRFDGFCLVSSDSDFTRLAQRLREEGLTVFGFGEKKTPKAFVYACDKFIYTEILRPDAKSNVLISPVVQPPLNTTATSTSKPSASVPVQIEAVTPGALELPTELMLQAIEQASDENGWAHLGTVGGYLTKIRPGFDPRLYGKRKLSELLKQFPQWFLCEERVVPGGTTKAIYVRIKK